jgi:transposase-like protein
MLHEIYNSSTKKEADKAFDRFLNVYGAKYKSATDCLSKDRDNLLNFYDFPAEHWQHIRTTNPIESTFATVRLRTTKTKGCGSSDATVMFVFKLIESASKKWQKLRGAELLADVIDIRWKFVDGIRKEANAA